MISVFKQARSEEGSLGHRSRARPVDAISETERGESQGALARLCEFPGLKSPGRSGRQPGVPESPLTFASFFRIFRLDVLRMFLYNMALDCHAAMRRLIRRID